MGLRESLESGKFAVTVELAPPKGTDISRMRETVESLAGWVDAANVTDNQRAVMRLSPLGACHLVQEWGLDSIMQMTCRDRNRLALQSDLLAADALGIHNILAMTGDFVTMGDHPNAKPVFDLDSVQLVATVAALNQGHDLAGNELSGKPNFFLGAVATPGAQPIPLHLMKLRKKIAAGAQFIQTQGVYNIEDFKAFRASLDSPVKVLAGIIPLRSARMASFMNENIPGIRVPQEIITRMEQAPKAIEEGIKIAVEIIEGLRGVCDGVHIMAIGMERYLPTILEQAGFTRN